MKYVYTSSDELKDIIKRIKEGECESFTIYDNKGRRVKYDFNDNLATILLIDDKVEQLNPYYKAPEEVVQESEVNDEPEEVTEDLIEDESDEESSEEVLEEDLESDDESIDESTEEVIENDYTEESVSCGDLESDYDSNYQVDTTEPEVLINSNDNSELLKEIEELKLENDKLQSENSELKSVNDKLQGDLNTANDKLVELENRVSEYEAGEVAVTSQSLEEILMELKTRGYVVTISI